jgi:hypothetical protein
MLTTCPRSFRLHRRVEIRHGLPNRLEQSAVLQVIFYDHIRHGIEDKLKKENKT